MRYEELAPLLLNEMQQDADWLAAAIKRLFRSEPARELLEPPQLSPITGSPRIDVELMMQSSLLDGDWTDDDMYCSQAVG